MSNEFLARIFGRRDDALEETQTVSPEMQKGRTEEVTIQEVVAFVEEIQSYYYNDICQIQSDIIMGKDRQKEEFYKAIMEQEDQALKQIDQIVTKMKELELQLQELWGKSIYTFYQEIEERNQKEVKQEIFYQLLNLCTRNVKEELNSVIENKVRKVQQIWNICLDVPIPKNENLILLNKEKGIETYTFSGICKQIIENKDPYHLSLKQVESIQNIKVEITVPEMVNEIWISMAAIPRLWLNSLRRTAMFDSVWEENGLIGTQVRLDRIPSSDITSYMKSMLSLLWKKDTYVVATVIFPTEQMLYQIGKVVYEQQKVFITKGLKFIWNERKGVYQENVQVARLDRRRIPQVIKFVPYLDLKKMYFK